MNKDIKILTIGSAMQDIFLQYICKDMLSIESTQEPHLFMLLEAGKKRELANLAYHSGGGATNSAVSCARLDCKVSSFFKVGKDAAGIAIINELIHNNVNIDHVIKTDDAHTGTSFVIPCSTGDRATLMHRGANLTLTDTELPRAAIAAHDYIYVTSLSGITASFIEPITIHAKKHNKIVAVNPGTSQLTAGAQHLRNALPNIDILILNAYEASLLMHELIPHADYAKKSRNLPRLLQESLLSAQPTFDLPTFFKTIHERGPRIVVVTNGNEGVYVAHNGSIYFHPSLDVQVVSTLGAGDAFSSCFVAQIAQGKSLEHAIRCGIANASSVIQHMDTKTGLLTSGKLEEALRTIDTNLLQTFDL